MEVTERTLVHIRKATAQDSELLLSLVHRSFEEYRGKIDPPSSAPDETIDTIRGRFDQARALIAERDQVSVGCVFYQRMAENVYLFRLSVLPEYRRRGIARSLIEHVERIAGAMGLPVRLGVRIALPENQAYYGRMGYRVVEYQTHPGYASPTWVMMEKDPQS